MSHDVLIIGAGPSGLVAAARCVQGGLETVVLEKRDAVGGLWRDLPDWQDIQLPMEDWAIAGTEISGVMRQHIHANLISFAERHQLMRHVRVGHPVSRMTRHGDLWHVQTEGGEVFPARFVIVATGPHQRRFIPEISRSNVQLREFHSSEFPDPAHFEGQSVAIHGAGASALDLLELAVRHDAREIHWVYRSLRWVIPSSKPKHARSYLRNLASLQMLGVGPEEQTRRTRELLKSKYEYFGIRTLMPETAFDFGTQQLIPARPGVLANVGRLHRHRDTIVALSGREIVLGASRFQADILVHATGYRIDLGYLGLDKLRGITTPRALNQRCGGLCKSLDYPNLFFLGITNAEMTGTTMWPQSMLAKSIVSHIKGYAEFPSVPVPRNVNHWDLLKLLASFDRRNYPPMRWRLKYLLLSFWYERFPRKLVRV